jgi:hypothetical protein
MQQTLLTSKVLLSPVTRKVDDVFACLFKANRPAIDITEMDALLKQNIKGRKQWGRN